MQITFTIPDDKISRITDAMKGLYPIPITIDKETGEEINAFTDGAWAKECIRKFIKKTVARYEQKIAQEAIAYSEDDSLAS